MIGPGFALQAWQIRLVLPHRPPILQLDIVEMCSLALDSVQACKAVGNSDPMLSGGGGMAAFLAPGALIEGLAQCCGLLVRLRWLAGQDADVAAFAAGDGDQLSGHRIPRSVLADSHAQFPNRASPGATLRFSARHDISRGDMHRFTGDVAILSIDATMVAAKAQITLKFPFSA